MSDKRRSLSYKWPITYGCIIVVAIIVVMLYPFCIAQPNSPKDSLPFDYSKLQEELSKSLQSRSRCGKVLNDTNITVNSKFSLIQEKLDSINGIQLIIVERQADLINDIRQETNNNIDKLNLWLAFAIGILGLGGVVFPIFSQYRIHVDNEREIDRKFGELESKFSNYRTTLENKLIDSEKKVESQSQRNIRYLRITKRHYENKTDERLNSFEKEWDRQSQIIGCTINKLENGISDIEEKKKYLETGFKLQEAWAHFLTISVGLEDRILDTQQDREKVLNYLFNRAIVSLDNFLRLYLEEAALNDDNHSKLMISLIMMNSLISKVKQVNLTSRRRELDRLTDKIRNILMEMEIGRMSKTQIFLLRQDIISLLQDLHKIRL